jgi:predicted negative regulator of RcsB-dependent stress response
LKSAAGPAYVATVSFVASRAVPFGGFFVALPGGVALARVAQLRGLRHGYGASLATLMAARVHVDANELDKAAASLKSVMDGANDDELRMIARMRYARVQAAQGKHDDALATLTVSEPGEFATRLADVRGDVLLAKGDQDGALREYLAARQGGSQGRIDTELLDLKIRDLGGNPPATAEES